jgi:hypothetical protein
MKRMSKIGRMCALALSIAGNVAVGSAAASRDDKALYVFSGVKGAVAYTVDRTGANLPQDYSPWLFVKAISTSGPTFKAGADKAALKEVRANGFSFRVFSVKFD